MTLREKFLELLKDYNPTFKNTESKGCEQIADDFAIGFAEWFFDKNWNKNILSAFEFKKQLEIYKKTL